MQCRVNRDNAMLVRVYEVGGVSAVLCGPGNADRCPEIDGIPVWGGLNAGNAGTMPKSIFEVMEPRAAILLATSLEAPSSRAMPCGCPMSVDQPCLQPIREH